MNRTEENILKRVRSIGYEAVVRIDDINHCGDISEAQYQLDKLYYALDLLELVEIENPHDFATFDEVYEAIQKYLEWSSHY